MKKTYIEPTIGVTVMLTENLLGQMQSDNTIENGSPYEGNTDPIKPPATDPEPTDPPEEGERNAKKAYIWDEW